MVTQVAVNVSVALADGRTIAYRGNAGVDQRAAETLAARIQLAGTDGLQPGPDHPMSRLLELLGTFAVDTVAAVTELGAP